MRVSYRMHLEVIARHPAEPSRFPPLLFVHGSCHGAWCWAEYFLPFFAEQGFDVHALSLRGHAGSTAPRDVRWTSIAEYVDDVASVAVTLPQPPIVIGHSLGGMVVQRYLEQHAAPAAVLMAPAPSTGMVRSGLRLFRNEPALILKPIVTRRVTSVLDDVERMQRILFSPGTPRADVTRYAGLMGEESFLAFAQLLYSRPTRHPARMRMLVVGTTDDAIIRPQDVERTARDWGATLRMFEGMGHDMMLDVKWKEVAGRMVEWMRDEG